MTDIKPQQDQDTQPLGSGRAPKNPQHMHILPTLQSTIRRAFLRLVLLFGALSLLLMVGIFFAVRMPSLLVRMNYDSISYAQEMEQAFGGILLDMLTMQKASPVPPNAALHAQFTAALEQAKGNITEPTEHLAVAHIATAWQNFLQAPSTEAAAKLYDSIGELVQVNEQGMLRQLDANALFRDVIVLMSALALLLGTGWAFWLADGVVSPLSQPLRRAAEVLGQRPSLHKKLHLPDPKTLEVRILFDELHRVWARLGEVDALNVDTVVQEKHKLEVILESAEDAVLVLDPQGQVLHVSSSMAALFSLDATTLLGQPWADLSTTSPNYLSLRAALQDTGQRDIILQVEGEEQVYSVRHRTLQTQQAWNLSTHQLVGQVFLLSNITEKRRREALRSEMMDWISHELKTPMQSLGLAAELMAKRTDLDADMRMLVETVNHDAERLRIVTRQFMDMARMSPLALQLTLEKVDISACIPTWLRALYLVAREAGISLVVDAQAQCPPVMLDVERFSWVLSNLVGNALRICPRGSVVRVVVRPQDVVLGATNDTTSILPHGVQSASPLSLPNPPLDTNAEIDPELGLVLEVEDNGPGMSQAMEKNLFQPYSHGRTAGSQQGLVGLGLAIVHTIVEAHGGRITHQRRNGTHTVFSVQLPLAQ